MTLLRHKEEQMQSSGFLSKSVSALTNQDFTEVLFIYADLVSRAQILVHYQSMFLQCIYHLINKYKNNLSGSHTPEYS